MKKFLYIIITLILIISLSLFAISYKIKSICVDTINDSMIKKEISDKVLDYVNEIVPKMSDADLESIQNNIQNSDATKDITRKFYDGLIDAVANDTDVKTPDISSDVKSLIDENMDVINKYGINGIKITSDMEDKLINNIDIASLYKNDTNKIKKNLTSEQIEMVKIYNSLTSTNMLNITIIISVIAILLLAAVSMSTYEWMKGSAISFMVSGFTLAFIMEFIVDKISPKITNKLLGRTANINIDSIVNLGYIYLAIGAVLIVIYLIICGYKSNKIKEQN